MAKIEKTEAEWRAQLSPESYRVTREHGTERPFTSPLNNEHREGTYTCIACGKPLFSSETKFDAHCGWPSFDAAIDKNAVETTVDRSHGMVRTEVHCADCAAHLGHVFPDGPTETGLRFCMNGAALNFEPEQKS